MIKNCKEEDDKDDKVVVTKLLHEIGVPSIAQSDFTVERVGLNRGETYHRPLKMKLHKPEDRRKIFSNAWKLKERSNTEFANVYFTPDLTKKQQEDDRILKQELKRRIELGERNLKIRRGRIVRVEGDSRTKNE